MVRQAALVAALAVKSAGSVTDVAGIAADAAASAGLSPDQAASIGMALEMAVRAAGQPDAAMQVENREAAVNAALASVALSAASVDTNQLAAPVPLAAPVEVQPVNQNRVYEVLRQFANDRQWVPLTKIAEQCSATEDAIVQAIEGMVAEDFVRLENRHIFVTDNGQRYLEYRMLTKS